MIKDDGIYKIFIINPILKWNKLVSFVGGGRLFFFDNSSRLLYVLMDFRCF